MAANFWQSSHFNRWTFTKERLSALREEMQTRTKFATEKELILQAHYTRQVQNLGKKLGYKQIVIATATTFFKRFYLLTSVLEYDPRIVAPTMLYLAAKVEEMGQVRPEPILNALEKIEKSEHRMKAAELFLCEMVVLEKLKFDLVLFHPYQDLERYVNDNGYDITSVFQTSWGILNDSQRTDCALVYPPPITALAALYIGCVHLNHDVKPWFDELNVNVDQVRECAADLIAGSKADELRPQQSDAILKELTSYWRSVKAAIISTS
jgi:cyclin C